MDKSTGAALLGPAHLELLEPRLMLAADPTLALASVTSDAVTVGWDPIADASQIRVYLAPEPSATVGEDLPGQVLVDTLPGNATSYNFSDLAASMNFFFRVEADVPGEEVASNIHARTIGGPDPSDTVLETPLREVLSYAPNILQVVMTDVQMDSSGTGNDGQAWQEGIWSVTRSDGSPIEILDIHRHTVPVGAFEMELGYAQPYSDNIIDVDHRLFFVLDEAIGEREVLTFDGPFDSHFVVPFSDDYIETPIIQLNQVGYNPRATERWAYVSGWMGDGGALPLSMIPNTASVVVEPVDPMESRPVVVGDLPITLRSTYDEMSGGQVDQIDLSLVPAAEGVKYRVQIPGVGVSWLTAVSEEAVYKAYYTVTRGMYHQRWGGEYYDDANDNGQFDTGETAYTDWVRDPDHPTVYTADTVRSSETLFHPEDTPLTGEREMVGGWHDAGDFDQSGAHPKATQILLRAYEIDSSRFNDNQLYLPETGNGIPDLLDEALWGVKGWSCLQEANGGVRVGVESWRHPWSYYFSDDDPLPYWTWSVDTDHTARVAGVFAQAAYLVAPYDPTWAAEIQQRAINAYNYAKTNGANESLLTYGAGELWRLTGLSTYKTDFETYYDNGALYSIVDAQHQDSACWDFTHAYMTTTGARADIVASLQSRINDAADAVGKVGQEEWAHRNYRTSNVNQDWGNDSTQAKYLDSVMAALEKGGLSVAQEQEYINVLSLAADYVLGGNANGYVWFTGLGTRHVENILQLDSICFDYLGQDQQPGIGVYGITEWISNGLAAASTKAAFYPVVGSEYPIGLRYGDTRCLVGNTEFTIHENQAPHIAMFASLLGDNMTTPTAWLPGQEYSKSDLPGGMTPSNGAPTVDAGVGQGIVAPSNQVTLSGAAFDDGFGGSTLTTTWSKVSGPGTVSFGNTHALETTATFSAAGTYVLELVASDGNYSTYDTVTVSIAGPEEFKTDDATVALYHFGNDLGDASYNGLTLTAYGNATLSNSDLGWMSTPSGQALRVQDAGDYVEVEIPDELFMRPNGSMTIEARLKVNAYKVSGVTAGPLIGLVQSWDANFTLTDPKWGDPLVQAGGSTVVDSTQWASSFSTGQWHTFKLTYDASTYTISCYVDDTLVGSVVDQQAERDDPWVLTIGNFDGYVDEVRISQGLRGTNVAPIVNAGPDQNVVLAGEVVLEGHVEDDGLPSGTVGYTWSKVSGPGTVSFSDGNALQTTAEFSAAGTYVLQLTANDGSLSSTDNVEVVVGGQRPWISAGDDMEVIGLAANLDGTVTDDGIPGPLTVTWSKVSGPGTVTFGANAIDTTATFSLPGIYVLHVEADDGESSVWDEMSITVRPDDGYEMAPDGSTIALWNFNNDTNDSSGHGYTLTLHGNAERVNDNLLWMTTPTGNALRVYDVGDYATVSIPDSVLQASPAPISLEVKFLVNSYKSHAVDNSNIFSLYQYTDAHLNIREGKWSLPAAPSVSVNGTPLVSNTVWDSDVQLGIWHDLKFNVDANGAASIYLDGELWATVTDPTNAGRTNDWLFTIGNFDGYIDEVRLSNVVRLPGEVTDIPPSVYAGADQTISLPDNDVNLDATVTDPDSTPTTTWTMVSGPGTVTFGDAGAVDTTATFSMAGNYVLRLTADDGTSQVFDDVAITVEGAVDVPPTVDAGLDQTIMLPDNDVNLDATVTDPDSTPTTIWTKVTGPGTVTFGDASAVDTTATFSTDGTYVLRLTADDGTTEVNDEVTITVNPLQIGDGTEFTVDADTLALYHFNSDYTDASSNGYDLTAYGNATLTNSNLGWMSNPSGQVLRFSALGDYVSTTIPDSVVMPAGGQSFTMELRFYVRNYLAHGVNNYPVMSFTQDWDTAFSVSEGKWSTPANPTVNMNSTTVVDGTTWANAVSLNAWHALKLTYDATTGTVACYIDDTLVGSATDFANSSRTNDWLLTLGNFDGDIDEVRLSNVVRVSEANDAPVATADSYSTDEDTQLVVSAANGVLDNDTDADSDPLTATLVSDVSNGTLNLASDGSFTYTPDADFNGTDSFTYLANDGTDNSNTATVTLTVNAVNDAPVATADSYSTDEDTQLVVSAANGVLDNDTDADSDPLTATLVSDVSNGTLNLASDGSFTYTPDADFNGTDSFTYLANDGNDNSNTATVTLTVNAVNDAPVVDAGSDDSITLPATASLDGTVTDVDSTPTVTWTKQSGSGTVTFGDANAVDTTAAFSEAGTYVLRLTASDGTNQAYDDVTITVNESEEFVADANTTALYHFNTDVDDSSGNGYDLTLSGNATLASDNLGWMNNPSGQVLRFSDLGDTATVNISDSAVMPASGQSFTLEARFYVRDYLAHGVDNYPIMSFSQSWDTAFSVSEGKWNNPANPTVNMNGTTLVDATTWANAVTLNEWHSLKLTYDATTGAIACYIDDTLIASGTDYANNSRTNDWLLTLGNFDGDIDEVRISSVVR